MAAQPAPTPPFAATPVSPSDPASAPPASEPSAPAVTAEPAPPAVEPAAPDATTEASSDASADAGTDAPADPTGASATTDALLEAAADAPAHVATQKSESPPPSPTAPARRALDAHAFVEGFPRQSAPRQARRYEGFSIRVSAGLGYANALRDLDAAPTEVTGLGGSVMLDVGSTVSENLIAFGRVGGFALNHARIGDSPNAGSAYFALLGAGARYHFLPLDWYASASLLLALMSVTSDIGTVENADPGLGVQLETGKQWPAGGGHDQTSIGLGLRGSYVRCGSTGAVDEPFIGKELSVVFSLSYN